MTFVDVKAAARVSIDPKNLKLIKHLNVHQSLNRYNQLIINCFLASPTVLFDVQSICARVFYGTICNAACVRITM